MWRSMLAAAVAASVIAAPVALAQTPAPPPPAASTPAPATAAPAGVSMTKAGKPLTPKQQKAKDCRAKWKEQKKTSGAKGRTEYRNFMKTCTTS